MRIKTVEHRWSRIQLVTLSTIVPSLCSLLTDSNSMHLFSSELFITLWIYNQSRDSSINDGLQAGPPRCESLQCIILLKNVAFWDVALCRSCQNWRFGGTSRFNLLGGRNPRARESVSRWRRHVSPERRFSEEPHGATSQKTAFFIAAVVETSNLTYHWLAGLCSGDVIGFLWGTNWFSYPRKRYSS
jgi:hypothetical protein